MLRSSPSIILVFLYYSTYILFCKRQSLACSRFSQPFFLYFFTISTHCLLHFPSVSAILCPQRKKRFRAGCNSRPAVQSASRIIFCVLNRCNSDTDSDSLDGRTIWHTVPVLYPFARKLAFRVFFCACNKKRGIDHMHTNTQSKIHKMVVTAMLSAVAAVLMFLEFSVPIMPSFIKLDISELPALLASFSLGPVYGVVVCLVKI